MPLHRDNQLMIVLGVCLSHADGDADPAELETLIAEVRERQIDLARLREALDHVDRELKAGRSADAMLAEYAPRLTAKARNDAFVAFANLLMSDGILFEAEVQRLAMLKTLLAIDDRFALGAVARSAAAAAVRPGGLAFG
ncbi:MAG: Tellurite resistance protein TerB [Planctomycetota bacterium]|jgi:hypothetical protein